MPKGIHNGPHGRPFGSKNRGRPLGSKGDLNALIRHIAWEVLQEKSRLDPKRTRLECIIRRAAEGAETGDWRDRQWMCGEPMQPDKPTGSKDDPITVRFNWDIVAGLAARAPSNGEPSA